MWKGRACLALLAVAIISQDGTALGGPSGRQILVTKVEHFKVVSDDISIPLERLANQYGVPIGFEASAAALGSEKRKKLRVFVENGTAGDVLTAIVAADPTYEWEETEGVINVFPTQKSSSLLDIVVSRFAVKNLGPDEAIRVLMMTTGVQQWLRQTGITRRDFVGSGRRSSRTFSLTLTDVPVRMVLNAILKASGSTYWVYHRYGARREFFMLTMDD